ncbi:hypothetical protein [Pseudoduganella aquatica]|uniref:Uncharacterized protein n=1 Tax=Pseudoduganella aquatica TaxID=2660641 RepID=A0A7X4HBA6_9BURK|nr:hypothetical protein [Pseudoduganella aquatica]MYN07142.1 hypothetical protein [Pseudoduganella aquatica]
MKGRLQFANFQFKPAVRRRLLPALQLSVCAAAAAAQPAPTGALDQACSLAAAGAAAVPGIAVTVAPGAVGDLPYAEARSAATGATARIYFEPALAQGVESKAACYLGLLDLLAPVIPDARRDVHWSAMTITTKPDYVAPKTGEARWLNVFRSAAWDEAALHFLIGVMPHEQVHFSQSRAAFKLPRWFQEGHAEWAGLQVTRQVRPDMAEQRRAGLAAERAKLDAPHLGAWGGMRVRPEAIERQMSSEERALKAKDPSYVPKGPFKFGPGDFVQDMSDVEGLYGAALALFDGLESRHGRAAVQEWISAVLASGDASRILPLAQEKLGEDIAPLLR